jgi:hypothetical protein|tara:strand:+ start:508 stop:1833 length:1326 start_codon:yes stop_codon:yes gene_type:complete
MNDLNLIQPTDFSINELAIVTKGGKISLRDVYEEINIHESMLSPCISGSIIINDSIGLSSKLLLDGTEILLVDIDKGAGVLRMKRSFRVYKQTDRRLINQTSESYVLRFASEEIILSEQQLLAECFKGTYTDISKRILATKLRVAPQNLKGIFDTSYGAVDLIIPGLKPFDALNWCAKRAIDSTGQPSFMFFENVNGYNFTTLSTIMKMPAIFNVNFDIKNLPGDNTKEELLGARAMEVMTQYDFITNTQAGVYAGTFVGIDPLTRQIKVDTKTMDNTYRGAHANKNPNFPIETNKLGKTNYQMTDSRVVYYVSTSLRGASAFIRENEPGSIQVDDTPQKYIFARKALLQNFVSQRVKVVLPGNFAVSPGRTINLEVPNRSVNIRGDNNYDSTLKGKYAILSTRHIIRYNVFETVAEVVTDSSEKQVVTMNKQQAQATWGY